MFGAKYECVRCGDELTIEYPSRDNDYAPDNPRVFTIQQVTVKHTASIPGTPGDDPSLDGICGDCWDDVWEFIETTGDGS